MLTDTIQVAPMSQTGFGTVLLIGAHSLYLRVMPGTLCETVGHEHIEHIGIGETYSLLTSLLSCLELVSHLRLVESQGHGSWLCSLQVEIH